MLLRKLARRAEAIHRPPRHRIATLAAWHNVCVYIADFMSDDTSVIEQRKLLIPEDQWQRTIALGHAHTRRFPGKARDGRPFEAWYPCVRTWF